jgi:hypothetical protein
MAKLTEDELLDRAFETLRSMLPEHRLSREQSPQDLDLDALWLLQAPGGQPAKVLVEAKARFLPRDVDQLQARLAPLVGRTPNATIVIVAPWLSPRSRALLTERRLNYIDLTGNIAIRISRPAVVIQTHGADRDPDPRAVPPAQLKGSRVNRIVRLLADVRPPYGVSALANAAGVSAGYVSRVLEALDEQALIQRGRRSEVINVEWARLLEARATNYDLLTSNRAETYVTQQSFEAILDQLRQQDTGDVVVTGSVAATQVAAITAPAQLVLYTSNPQTVRTEAKLLPATRGANVVLLRPADVSQVDRPRLVKGIAYTGLSQLAMDCLAGNGRLPEEGEAIMRVMAETEHEWRLPTLPALAR